MWRAGQRMLCVWPVQIRTAGRLAEVLQVCGPCISRASEGSAQEEGADWTHVCVSMSSLVGSFMELSTFELGSRIMVGVGSCQLWTSSDSCWMLLSRCSSLLRLGLLAVRRALVAVSECAVSITVTLSAVLIELSRTADGGPGPRC